MDAEQGRRPNPEEGRPYVMLQDLEPGTRVRLAGGDVAEVTGNPKDGSWLFVRRLSEATGEDMVFANDVVEVVDGDGS